MLRRTRRRLRAELAILHSQVAALQRTTADLVSADDISTVLARLASRASSAVRAERFLLAVRLDGQLRVQGAGIGEEDAERLGAGLLGTPEEVFAACGDLCLVADVASARTHYGRFAAYFPSEHAPTAADRELWHAYARLAAAALDSTSALAAARHRGETAEALLGLGRALTAAEEPDEVAQRLAHAIPRLTGSDRGAVLLWRADVECLSVSGVSGYDSAAEALARGIVITPADTPALPAMLTRPGPLLLTRDATDPWIRGTLERLGTQTLAVVPIVLRGDVLGIAVAGWVVGHAPRCDTELFGRLAGLADQAATALGNARLLQQTRYAATHDGLTGLPNRALLTDRLSQAVAAQRRTGEGLALVFVDLDGFKEINDVLGHAVGDGVLREVAARLLASVRATDTVARYGGDEFLILLGDVSEDEDAELVASSLLAALTAPLRIDGHDVAVSASLGICAAFEPTSPETLLRQADMAMYRAKAAGRGTYRFAAGVDAA